MPREPAINAPLPVLGVAAILIVCFLIQQRTPDEGIALALYPYAVTQGEIAGLLTSLFLHANWPHVLMNTAFAVAFGSPVARLLGGGARGAGGFLLFYIVCGVLAGLAFVAVHPQDSSPVLGASGAVAGLMGAAGRLLDRPGSLGPMFSRTALSLALAWLIINLLAAFSGVAQLMGADGIAWEAHLGGFVAGLLLIGPFHRIFSR